MFSPIWGNWTWSNLTHIFWNGLVRPASAWQMSSEVVTSADDVPPSQQIIQKVQDAYQVPWFFFGKVPKHQTYQVIDSKGIISRIHMNQAMCQCVVVQDHLLKGLVLQYGLSALHVLACCQLSRLCIAPPPQPMLPFQEADRSIVGFSAKGVSVEPRGQSQLFFVITKSHW